MLYSYEIFIVSDNEYQQVNIGDTFRDGVLVDGLGGLENDCLHVVAHEYEEEDLMARVPAGWSVKFLRGMVLVAHSNHAPKAISYAEAMGTAFQDWPKVAHG